MNPYQRFFHLLLALVFLGLPVISHVQSPVIVSDDLGGNDVGYGLDVWDSTTLANASAGLAGPAQVWDFGAVSTANDFESISYLAPSNSPGRNFFPSASTVHEWYSRAAFDYFEQDQDVLRYLGEFNSDRVAFVYSDPKDLLHFPVAYGDAFTDSFSVNWVENGQSFNRLGRIEREVDGYGELRVRGNSYDQVLRVRTVEDWTEQGPNGTVVMRREYHSWFRANAPFPLAEVGFETDGTDTTRFGSSVGAIIVCICWGPVEDGFLIYPNPVRTASELRYYLVDDAPVSMQVMDVSGRIVGEKSWGMVEAGEYTEPLELNDLPNGVYLVKMVMGENEFLKKLIIDR